VTASVSLPYAVPNADLAVFDAAGRRLRTLIDGPLAAGRQIVTWGGSGDDGRRAPSGVYFMRLAAGRLTAVKKVLLIR
jgi:flagellar hook assembly protein FlgD